MVTVNNHLGIGRDQNSQGQYDLNGGLLTTGYLFVGNQGTGIFNHEAATHTITGYGYVGSDTTGIGTYNLLQNGILKVEVNGGFVVGSAGLGTFNQSAGSTFTTGSLFVGDSPRRSNPAGELQDGGTFNQDGGDTTVSGHLGVGRNAGGTGTYNLRGDKLTVGDLFVGYEGTGTFRQTGGIHKVTGTSYVGYENTGVGAYYLEDGALQGTNAVIGVNGSGRGDFTQSGGTHTLTGDLTLGLFTTAAGHGTYNLTGDPLTSILDVRYIYLNPNGILKQTGGALRYQTFYHQGGEVQGSLENRSVYIYDGGVFSGRLLNYGTVTFNADFTAGNGLAHYSTPPLL